MSSAHDIIHIACQADRKFAADCGVMLHSLFSGNPGEVFEIHFLHDGSLPASDFEGLAEIARRFGGCWSPQLVPSESLAGFPWVAHYGGHAAWYRLFLHRLLPRLPKILYLDADLLVLDCVRPLWETDLTGRCVAAVTNSLFDYMAERIQCTLGMPIRNSYFNSGVLLLNLDELRRTGLGERVIALVREGRIPFLWPDQDALNTVLWPHRVPLHPRWNATNGLFDLPRRYMPWTAQELAEATARPAIVHFVGPFKPRHYRLRHPYRARYFEHLAQTRWKDAAIEGRTLRNMLFRPLPVLWQWRIEDAERSLRGTARRLRHALWRR